MRHRARLYFILCFAFTIAGALPCPRISYATDAAPILSETDKIEALLRCIDGLKDAVFIRNGQEHDGRAAAKHLRSKWNAQRAFIKTARDFVQHLASRSSISGRPYLVRWKSGQTQTSESFLLAELKKLEDGQTP